MAKDSDPRAGTSENTGGLVSSILAEENEFDRRLLWRLGSWGFAAVVAVAIAVMANQAQFGWRRDQVAAADLAQQAQQAQQIQQLARETQNEARRLAAAVDTLNNDRDRLYTRVTAIEQGLDSVTGAVARQNTAASASAPSPAAPAKPHQASSDPTTLPLQPAAPAVAPVASAPAAPGEKPRAEAAPQEQAQPPPAAATSVASAPPSAPGLPLVASKSMMSPPDPAAAKLVQPEKTAKPKTEAAPQPETAVAASPPAQEPEAESDLPKIPAQRTEFAVDLGSAHSIGGLRALWRGLVKANPDLAALRPIIIIRENRTGAGMQLRLGAGPLLDAAAAAKICATLAGIERGCETAVFDGQRLAMKTETKAERTPPPGAVKPTAQPHEQQRKSTKRSKSEEPPAAKPEPPSAVSSFFGRK